jgi:hypothetical protein
VADGTRAVLQAKLVARKPTPRSRLMAQLRRPLALLESVLDPLHSIWRRRQSEQVLDDLCLQRVSHSAAQERLEWLSKIQKGGWLTGKS